MMSAEVAHMRRGGDSPLVTQRISKARRRNEMLVSAQVREKYKQNFLT